MRSACGSDRDLFQEVMSLLEADSTETVLNSPLSTHTTADLLNHRYRVQRELGRGGLGVVYLAHDETLHNRAVVVKMPLDRSSMDPWLADKFAQEVKALALIDHPGVVGALDSGVAVDGRPFLVIQYVEGRPLKDAISAGGVPLDFAAQVLEEIGHALGAAHARGVWHRDLKPANIMLQSLEHGRERVRIIDFGIATVRDAPTGLSSTKMDEVGTRVAGTPHYMAPEQFEGRVSAASDIFAMGVIAYELVTGRKPFRAGNERRLYDLQKAGVTVAPSQLRPGVSAAADKLIVQALSFRPKDRPAEASDFGDELARALTVAETPAPKPSRRVALLTGGVAGAVVIGGGAWWIAGSGARNRVSWSLMVKASPNQPAVAAKTGMPLRVTDSFYLAVRAPGGSLYLLSDDPSKDTLNYLGYYPLRSGEENHVPENRPFVFDGPDVVNLWCVWSPETIAELDSLGRLLNAQDRGVVSDAAERVRTRQFLAALPQAVGGARRRAWQLRVEARTD